VKWELKLNKNKKRYRQKILPVVTIEVSKEQVWEQICGYLYPNRVRMG